MAPAAAHCMTGRIKKSDYLAERDGESADAEALIGPKRTQILSGVLCKPFKGMAGMTRLELATSAVTAKRLLVTTRKHATRMALEERFREARKQFVDC